MGSMNGATIAAAPRHATLMEITLVKAKRCCIYSLSRADRVSEELYQPPHCPWLQFDFLKLTSTASLPLTLTMPSCATRSTVTLPFAVPF